jgi:hypothetical protein
MPDRYWRQLYQYWQSKCVDGRPPSRADIDPIVDIPQLTKNLMLIDVRSDYTYRLVGSEVVARHGMDMTGRRPGSSGKDPSALSEWTKALDYVREKGQPQLLISRIGSNSIAKNIMLALPLIGADGAIEMILVGSFYNEHFTAGSHVAGMTVHEIMLTPPVGDG